MLTGLLIHCFLSINWSFGLNERQRGHLKPFGNHREPEIVTDELLFVPDPTQFWEQYVSKNRPVVFREAAKHSRWFLLAGFTVNISEYAKNVCYFLACCSCEIRRELKAATSATATKKSLENKYLGNGDYFVIIASSSHDLLLTEHAANGLVEAQLK